MKLFKTYTDTAREYGWDIDVTATSAGARVVVGRPNLADGFPHLMTGVIDGNTMKEGRIVNDYGDGPEEFKAGFRYHLAVMRNIDYPLRYKLFYEMFLMSDPAERSEKALAKLTGLSERQIRKARMCGFADGDQMDALCMGVLRMHPSEVFGNSAWQEAYVLDDIEAKVAAQAKELLDNAAGVA